MARDRVSALHGELEYRVYRSGEIVEHVRGPNLVVNGAHDVITQLLGGGGPPVTKFGVGTNGTDPIAEDRALADAVLVDVVGVSYPAPGRVAFDWVVGGGTANGMAIKEFGLLTTGGVLIARKVRSAPIAKAADVSISGTWTLHF